MTKVERTHSSREDTLSREPLGAIFDRFSLLFLTIETNVNLRSDASRTPGREWRRALLQGHRALSPEGVR